MKTKSRIILGLLLLGAVVWACTDIVFVFKADAVEVTAEQVGKTLVITIPVNATGYDGSNGGPVTLGVKATGPFTVLGVTVDIQYGQNGAPGTIKISGVPTQGGTSTGTFIVTPKCGTFPGGDVTIKWTIHVPGGPIPTIANLPGQKLRQHPIGTYTGELFDQQSHLNQNGPLPFGLNIYYASYLKANNVTSALGTNWMHNYDLKLAVTSTSATATLFQGKTVSFSKSNNLWQLSASERRPYQLIAAGTGYQLLSPVSQLIYSFDSSGALTKIQDRAGNALTIAPGPGGAGPAQVSDGLGRALTFTYSAGNLTKVADQAGRSVSFEYTSGSLTGITDENGKKSTYAYATAGTLTGLLTAETKPNGNQPYTQTFDTQGRVNKQSDSSASAMNLVYNTGNTGITEPQGVSFTDNYDANGNLTSIGYASAPSSQFTYDTKNRPTAITDRTGAKSTVTYDPVSGLPATVTDQLNNTTTFKYAASSQSGFTFYDLQSITLPDGATIAFTRDAKGNVTSLTDQTGKSWQATWNDRGQIQTFTNPSGGVTTFAYGNDSNLVSVQVPSGETTKVAYDNADRPNLITHPDDSTVATQYDAAGNPTKLTDERNNPTSLSYDANNNLLKVTDALGNAGSLAYDNNDRVKSATDPLGKTTSQTFDSVARLATTTDATNVTLNYAYNNQNQLTSITDAGGKGPSITNDPESRVTAVTDALSRKTSLTRNARGEVTAVTTPNNEKTTLAYDALGRVTSITDALGRTTQFRYDKRGSLSGATRPDGATESYERNELGLITTLTNPKGNTWRAAYDSSGRLVSFTNPLGNTFSYTYDSRQRLASETNPLGNVQYSYDAAGNLTRALFSDGTDLKYTYDQLNRLTSADGVSIQYDAAGRIVKYNDFELTYDAAGRIASITYGPGQVARYTYNNLGLLSQLEDWAGGKATFTYDAARQLTSKTFANGIRADYTYDLNGRPLTLKVAQGSQTLFSETVKRDSLGRITSDDISGITLPEPTGYVSQQFDAADQTYAAEYDALGRVTKDALRTYTWDLAGRLLSYTGIGGSATFTYDGLGHVITRTPGAASALESRIHPSPRAGELGVVSRIGPVVLNPGIPEILGDDLNIVSLVQENGTSQPVIPNLGGNVILTPGDLNNLILLPPGGGPTVFQGNMPAAFGTLAIDPTANLRFDGGTVTNENTSTPLADHPFLLRFQESFPTAFKTRRASAQPAKKNDDGATGVPRTTNIRQPSETIAQRLRAAGAVLLGKANLSEWANFRNFTSSSGWANSKGVIGSGDPAGTPGPGASGASVWENFDTATLDFGAAVAYTSNATSNLPPLGTATVTGNFAPLSTVTRSATENALPIPRFVGTSSSANLFNLNICRTNLLYPFVNNTAGFDTGLAISNTSTDPFGTSPNDGPCDLTFYGTHVAAPSTASVPPSTVYTTLANSGCPGFQGYIIAVCNFQLAHGFAFVSDIGASHLATSYLALVLPDSARSGSAADNLGR